MAERKYVNWTKDEGGVATLVINNPPMNVCSTTVATEIKECCDEVAADDSVLVLIVSSAGERAFMAGADISEFPKTFGKPDVAKEVAAAFMAGYNALDFLPKPTIAAIQGYALGGGMELAMACDIRIAAENAQMGQPEIKLGILPGIGGTQRLTRLVGEGKAKELLFTGDPITAAEALSIGLVNKVVPKGEALNAAREMAKTIASRSGFALRLIKTVVDEGVDRPLREGLKLESQAFADVLQSEDAREGVDAFLNKRQPQFKHR